ncbi:Hsp20/alpha crystallin family protein [Pelomonas aquatica]|jgi:HSP20 family protein|uniref:Hsp20/alpha crystallin family protein n=1 Tax=Pelomonas aquatica TaxID=431058 RepID=A0A9X4LDZ7_9BURK|nr:Hsp20/alpha crystallin family protein [Pelomonas aquatica]MCY4754958.1 Hsp20/alpha crystallin family protein [Pelomonas aquatica]MDG0861024.1 Hsp20/alpha crystallin family protein [Pelomonas aquatica]
MFYLTHPRHVARVLRQFDADSDAARTPALDVSEDDKGYHVTVDMPGVAKEAVKVRVEGRRVHIETAAEEAAAPTDGSRLLYRERRAARYARSFSLPVEIDPGQSQARFENGVLTLDLGKRVADNGGQLTVN